MLCIHKRVQRYIISGFLGLCLIGGFASTAQAEGLVRSTSRFYYKERSSGKVVGARIVRQYRQKIATVRPQAEIDPRLDPRLRRAASFAQERAHARTKARCWRYVKEALVAAGVVNSYPKTPYAFQAGEELVRNHGFKKLPIRDPYAAPVGAVIVYGKGSGGAGHVEIRTRDGFVSDYRSKNKCFYPVLAVYGKFSS